MAGAARDSKHFQENIRKYKFCFQNIFFAATNIMQPIWYTAYSKIFLFLLFYISDI